MRWFASLAELVVSAFYGEDDDIVETCDTYDHVRAQMATPEVQAERQRFYEQRGAALGARRTSVEL